MDRIGIKLLESTLQCWTAANASFEEGIKLGTNLGGLVIRFTADEVSFMAWLSAQVFLPRKQSQL